MEDELETQRLSPLEFENGAEQDLTGWQLLLGCRVIHPIFGPGTISSIQRKKNIFFFVLFDEPTDGVGERQFLSKGFGRYFTQLILPASRAEQIQKFLETKPESRAENSGSSDLLVMYPLEAKKDQTPIPGVTIGPKAKPRKLATDRFVKCPFCIFRDSPEEVNLHVKIVHGQKYPSRIKRIDKSPNRSRKTKETQNTQKDNIKIVGMGICPLCSCRLNPNKYVSHLLRVHPGESIEKNPLTERISVEVVEKPAKKKRKRPKKPNRNKAPDLLNFDVLHIGRKNKRYTRRY